VVGGEDQGGVEQTEEQICLDGETGSEKDRDEGEENQEFRRTVLQERR
jgi:hypothetical protein